jgi:transitional endoplasmic reticulum ATPase
LLRPGRFDRILEIPIPNKEARKQIFEIHLKKKPIDSTVDVDKLAELTDGYTGADIAAIVNAAAMSAIKDQISWGDKNNITTGHKQHLTISMKHLETGLQKISKKDKGIRNTEII